ncbi:hypothetical protein BGW39_000434 [Mortierella sp. 14UC]|nr:hypothetical protein BGW39_000434 [Mortierella sp. 14UC]
MTAFDFSEFKDALDDVSTKRCSAALNSQAQRCSKTASSVVTFRNIDTYLCSYHETYKKGAIFRKQVPDFEETALLSANQPVSSETGMRTLNTYLHRKREAQSFFSGAQLDELTTDLHPAIKANILHFIQDYLLFLDDSPDRHKILMGSKSQFGARYRQHVLKDGSLDDCRLGKFEKECISSGCVFVVQVDPTDKAVAKMNDDGQAASDGLAIMVGFTTNLKYRLENLQGCSINTAALSTFPPTSPGASKCASPVVLVELLAGRKFWSPTSTTSGAPAIPSKEGPTLTSTGSWIYSQRNLSQS